MTELSDEAPRASLFENFERTDQPPKTHEESSYSYLNRASDPNCDRLRNLLEEWFMEYPAHDASDLSNRFKSDNRKQHFPAWWELYVFTLFKSLGFQVDVHPKLATSRNRPDFLAKRDNLEFYVEAATFFSDILDSGRSERDGWIYDAVNKLKNPYFFVGLEIEEPGVLRPRVTEITIPLKRWLESLDPNVVEQEADASDRRPERVIQAKDWRLRFSAYPIPLESRTKGGSILGVYPTTAGMVKDREAAVRTLKKKRSKYGILDKPYVIALLPWAPFFNTDDAVDALFGERCYSYIENGPVGQQVRPYRLANGVWRRNAEQGAGISAVLIAEGSELFEPASILPRLWLNPWATLPIETDNLPFPTTRVDDEGVLSHANCNVSARSVFGLSSDWSDQKGSMG